jgi:hypothetical protein
MPKCRELFRVSGLLLGFVGYAWQAKDEFVCYSTRFTMVFGVLTRYFVIILGTWT